MHAKKIIIPGIVAVAALAGVAAGSAINSLSANAESNGGTYAATTAAATPSDGAAPEQGERDESKGGHVGENGKTEELLTGDTATKVKAAAEKAVSGGTVLRVETDAEGAVYEAHVRKSDGTQVTVKMDENFNVSSVENGPGGPGRRDTQDDDASSSST